MAPGGSKRKRPERGYSNDDGSNRPSPHRPEAMHMTHNRPGGGRGGRGGPHRRHSRNDEPQSFTSAPPIPRSNSNTTLNQTTPISTPVSAALESNVPTQRPSSPIPPATEDASAENARPPALYAYEHLTEEILSGWTGSGRTSFVNLAKDANELAKASILQDLVRAVLDRRLDVGEGGSALRELMSDDNNESVWTFEDCFIHTISLLDESDTKNHLLQSLVNLSNIDPELLRNELDIPLLGSLGLVRNTFNQMRTRKTTNILYRQANFNLLREESEGYAKLLTEYFNTAQEASSNRELSHSMAEDAFQRVMALVGAFDLDVGRVLDITLDISANLLVKAYGFFMKFYRCSSWWPNGETFDNVKWTDQGFTSFPDWALPGSIRTGPTDHERQVLSDLRRTRDVAFWQRVSEIGQEAFYDLGGRQIIDFDSVAELLQTELEPELDAKGKETRSHQRRRVNEDRKYMRETKTIPLSGNPDAAQLLGFKLRYYASVVRDAHDVIPENLIALAALLIKIGFISLRDLYPHLHPQDELMPAERTRLEKEKAEKEAKERPGAGANALLLAGALPDDAPAPPPPPPVRNARLDKEKSGANTPKPEVAGAVPEESLPAADNQKIMLLRALLLVGALPEALYILGRFPWLIEVDLTIVPHLLRIVRQMLSHVSELVRPMSDRLDLDETKGQVVDVPKKPVVTLSLATRPTRKSIRWLGLDKVDEKDGQEYRYYYPDWADNVPVCQTIDDVVLLCDTFIALLGVRIGQDAEVLGILVRLARFSLDSDESESNRTRWLNLMKRLLVPALSFTKHNPGLTHSMFELLSYFPITTRFNLYSEWFTGKTSRLPEMQVILAYNKAEAKDVLRRVSNENGKKYARALAKITYSSPGVVMMYMISQLESYSNMIPALVECARFFPAMAYDVLNWCLINSLNGGGKDRMQADGMLTSPWLQALSSYVASLFARYHHVLDPAPILQYLASELRAGNSTDLEMFEQLLGEMAGVKADSQFNDTQVQAMAGGAHLQSIVLQQLADTRHLRKNPAKRLVRALNEPGLVGQLLIAVAQERQMYQHRSASSNMPLKVLGNNVDKVQQVLAQYLDVLKTYLTPHDFDTTLPDVMSLIKDFGLNLGLAFTICRSNILYRMAEHDEAKRQEEIEERKRRQNNEKTNGEDEGVVQNTDLKPTSVDTSPWHPVLLPIIDGLKDVAADIDDRVGLPFYVTFWTLSQSDIVVFTESYTAEIDRISKQMSQLSPERNDSSATMRDKERKKKALQELSDKLRHEVKTRVALYSKVSNRLSHREKAHWFPKVTRRQELDARHVNLLQDCFLPRAMNSALDAHYSYLMLRLLHDKGTPGFSTAHLFSQLFRKQELSAIIFQCTALQAQHFARFLNEILRMLLLWHSDKAIYEKEAIGTKTKLPGFAKPFDSDRGPEVFVDYESFRRLVSNWHTALSGALQICFESAEYSHIRNGIMLLKGVCQNFPALNYMGRNLLAHVVRLSQEETRQDLKLMAMSLIGPLKNREKKWVDAAHFRLGDPAKDAKAGRPASAPKSEVTTSTSTKLDATAAEFDPNSTNGSKKIEKFEDGEVEDEKTMNSSTKTLQNGETRPRTTSASHHFDSTTRGGVQRAEPGNAIPNKPDGSRSQTPLSNTSRVPHDLPSRPDRLNSRSTDTNGYPKVVAVGRVNERGNNWTEDHHGRVDRHVSSRSGTRDNSPARGRGQPVPSTVNSETVKDNRAQSGPRRLDYVHARREQSTTNITTNSPMAGTHPDRAGFINSVVSAPAPPVSTASAGIDGSHFENPARLAQINSDHVMRDRGSEHRPDTRSSSRADQTRPPPPRFEPPPSENAPTGPRRGGNRFPGRDNGTSTLAAESTYGRLNGGHDTPSGPRNSLQGPPGRASRNMNTPTTLPNSPSATERLYDNGYARGPPQAVERRQGHGPPSETSSANETPVAGIHPSRLAQLGNVVDPAPPIPSGPPQGPRSSIAQPQAPSGPRGTNRNANAPSGPSLSSSIVAPPPTPSNPPRVTSNTPDRQRPFNRDSHRPNSGVPNSSVMPNSSPGQNQPSSRDVSFRGASSRQASFTKLDASTHSVGSPMEPAAKRAGGGQTPEGSIGRPGTRGELRPDLFQRPEENEGRNGVLRANARRDDDPQALRRRPNPHNNMDMGRDKRYSWDPRNGREEPPGPDAANYGPPLRADWERSGHEMRDQGPVEGPRRGGGRSNGRGDGFRGAGNPWPDERPVDGGGGGGLADGRKRRHDEAPSDATKRRRSAR